MMRHWNFWDNNKCLNCPDTVEDTVHILLCPHQARVDAWDDAVDGFEAWMTEVDTDPDIYDCFSKALRARNPAHLFAAYASDTTIGAATDQDKIGWVHFLEGKVALKWRELQDDHYTLSGSRKTSKGWAEGLVNNLLTLVHKLWKSRNDAVYEQDDLGLKVKDGQELEEAISEQFELGLEGLLPQDSHYINRGREAVDTMTAAERKTWLHGVRLAREIGESEVETEVTQLRDAMWNWLIH